MPRATTTEPPDGFLYRPDFLTPDEERAVADELSRLPYSEVRIRDVPARRRVMHFGWVYTFESHELLPGPPLPESLVPFRDRAAEWAGIEADRFEEILVTEYTPGATIGWHRDAPAFGASVVGISLLSACRMRFRRRRGEGWETYSALLEPRSAYIVSGAARSSWQHSIPAGKDLRYSITLRTLRRSRAPG